MHCRRCGKYMESSDELCTPCKAAMLDKVQSDTKSPSVQSGSFGVAVAAAILAFVGVLLAAIALVLTLYHISLAAVVLCVMISNPCLVLCVIFGIRSIVFAVRAKKNSGKIPVFTLVSGCIGLGGGVITLYLDFLAFLFIMSV